MKKIALLLTIFAFIVSCEQTESPTIDPIDGQVAMGFESGTTTVTVTSAGATLDLNVLSVTRTSVERSIDVSIDASSTGASADYQIGSVIIPANEHIGVLTIDFNNFSGMTDCETSTLVLNLETGSPGIDGPQTHTISYLREFDCPDLYVNVTFDDYPGETSWDVVDSDGNIIAEGDDYTTSDPISENICVCPGDYTFTIYDSWGDGICCTYGNGAYDMTLNGTQIFSGGSFGSEISHSFTLD